MTVLLCAMRGFHVVEGAGVGTNAGRFYMSGRCRDCGLTLKAPLTEGDDE